MPEPTTTLPPAASPEPPAADGKTYTVAKGDTLTRIAKVNGVTVGAITRANQQMDLSKLKPGKSSISPWPRPPLGARRPRQHRRDWF